MTNRTACALCSTFVLATGLTYAQGPQRTTATYEDWTVSCTMTSEANTRRSCEIASAQTAEGQGRVSQITIARTAEDGSLKVFVQVPANLWLENGVKLFIEGNDKWIVAKIKWCLPARCLADTGLVDDAIKSLQTATGPGRIEIKDAGQQDISIPVSFKGFAQAFLALQKD